MKGKLIASLVMTLFISSMVLPVLGIPATYEISGKKTYITSGTIDVNLDVAITTDWVNGWQDHGLRIREFAIDGEVWAYSEISSDDLYGLYFTQRWWYDNGTGLINQWEWSWTIEEHWTSAATWSWWQIGLDYGKGVGIIETLINNESLGYSNWYAMGNTKPNKPTISGETKGGIKTNYNYTFNAVDPDGFNLSYFVDWGDDTTTGWTTFEDSSVDVILAHSWNKKGDYIIKCKVKDLAENESEWVTLNVTMPRSQTFVPSTFLELLKRFVEQFTHAFPIMRHLIKL